MLDKLSILPARKKPSLRIRGVVNDYGGYGLHLQHTARCLLVSGYATDVVPHGEPSGVFSEIKGKLIADPKEAKRELVILPPDYPARAHQWLFTMYETTRLPLALLKNVSGARVVFVPSSWVAQCFNAQGVEAPVHVIPLGYDESIFYPKFEQTENVVFGVAGNPTGTRKNIELAVEAFSLAFKSETDVRLRIKLQPGMQISTRADPRIDVTCKTATEAEIGDWMRSLTIYVNPAKSEAFGLFNLQAMACGVPVIACPFGGVTDYFSDAVGYCIDYALVQAQDELYTEGLWAEPSLPSLVAQLRRAYADRSEIAQKSKLSRLRAKDYTWSKSVEKLENLLDQTGYWEKPSLAGTAAPEDHILQYYRSALQMTKPAGPDLSNAALTNTPRGLGDTLLLTHLPRAGAVQGKPCYIHADPAEHKHFECLMRFNPYYMSKPKSYDVVAADVLQRQADMGNGHFIQRLQRVFGLEPELKPKPYLDYTCTRKANRVVMHFEAGGPHSSWQRTHIHPRARQLYPETRKIIQEFVDSHPELEFVQIGTKQQNFKRVRSIQHASLSETVRLMASASWFLGIVSGPMHLAAAFELKSIVILNFPPAHRILLPTLLDIDQVESEWLYPQNVHLHQESEGPLVPRFTYSTLASAFDGKIYPYWSDKFLHLIHERL